jgi:hypothetical protein
VEEAYQRSDLFERRRDLMLDWARYVEGGASPGEKSCGSCKQISVDPHP